VTLNNNQTSNVTIAMSQCVPINSLVGIIRDTTNTMSRAALPLLLQAVTNVMLIIKLKSVSQMVTKSVLLKREKRFAFTITILNTLYICVNLITLTSTIFINIYGYNQTYVSTSSYESALASLIYVFVNLFGLFFNCDLVFFINLLSNKTYRQEAKKILLPKKK
jgi:hypothetical protein